MTELELTGIAEGGTVPLRAAIERLVIAGWTGRDRAAMEAHMAELEKIGIARPKSAPIFYRVAAALLSTGSEIEVPGHDSSGEVEPVLVGIDGRTWIGVGSDHTDRKVEAIGITISKQLCAKPIGPAFWPFDEVADHWDRLVIRSFAIRGGQRRLYQEGPLARMRPPGDLLSRYLGGRDAGGPETRGPGLGDVATLPSGMAMFCGTMAVHGEIEPADAYELEMEDPVRGRRLSHSYRVTSLPVEG